MVQRAAYEGAVNAVDSRVLRSADQRPVNTSEGDEVNLDVDVEFRSGENDKATVIESAKLRDKPALSFGTDNRYVSWFKPVRAGAYAFHIKGTISDASKKFAGPVTIDETSSAARAARLATPSSAWRRRRSSPPSNSSRRFGDTGCWGRSSRCNQTRTLFVTRELLHSEKLGF